MLVTSGLFYEKLWAFDMSVISSLTCHFAFEFADATYNELGYVSQVIVILTGMFRCN